MQNGNVLFLSYTNRRDRDAAVIVDVKQIELTKADKNVFNFAKRNEKQYEARESV